MIEPTAPHHEQNWVMLEAENGDQKAIYRLRTDRPSAAATYATLVTVEWHYTDQNDAGFPSDGLQQAMGAFEETIESLCSGDSSQLMLVITGMGLKEWAFYTTDFETFIAKFNEAMNGAPQVPIQISYSEDANWEYWENYRKHAR